MSLLDNLTKKFSGDKNTVTLSVRVTSEENAVLQEIADVVGCNRQDVIYQLIQDYAIPEWLYAIAYMDISSNYPDICP